MPKRENPDDDAQCRAEELLSIVPRNPKRPYDVRRILSHVFDHDSVFETGRNY